MVNEGAAISAEIAVRLEDAFAITAEFWLDLQKAYDIWRVKQIGKVQGIHRIAFEPIGNAS